MKEIKQITAIEAKAISSKSSDVITQINEIIYESAACGYGGFFMLKKDIAGFYELDSFLKKHYTDHGFVFWNGPNNDGFSINWDGEKEETNYAKTNETTTN